MAATAWSFYNSFREYIGNGQFDLDGTSIGFYVALHTSAARALVNTNTLSKRGDSSACICMAIFAMARSYVTHISFFPISSHFSPFFSYFSHLDS